MAQKLLNKTRWTTEFRWLAEMDGWQSFPSVGHRWRWHLIRPLRPPPDRLWSGVLPEVLCLSGPGDSVSRVCMEFWSGQRVSICRSQSILSRTKTSYVICLGVVKGNTDFIKSYKTSHVNGRIVLIDLFSVVDNFTSPYLQPVTAVP